MSEQQRAAIREMEQIREEIEASDEIAALQARVEELEAALFQWRDIGSAPTDGTEFLAYAGSETAVVWWSNERDFWLFAEDNYPFNVFVGPTHWMPLPTPPRQDRQ